MDPQNIDTFRLKKILVVPDHQNLSRMNNNQRDSDTIIEVSRKRKPKRPFSPELDKRRGCTKTKQSVKKTISSYKVTEVSSDSLITFENAQPLRCDNCQSPYAIDPSKRKKWVGSKIEKPKFRKRLDTVTNKILTLCNKCGLSMSRVSKRAPRKPLPTQEDKNSYLAESESFTSYLAERLNEPDAKRLYCPCFKSEPCGCLQKYLKGKDNEDSLKVDERASKLIELLKTAKHLSGGKMHTTDSIAVPGSLTREEEPLSCHGIGNRHSKMFEEFVLSNRLSLREELHLCERASQRVLMYSNNFLHKELKSMKNQRIERKTGKYVKGLLKPIPDLPLATCCNDQCVQLALTHPKLLESWRLSAQGGQREARRVLAEMLTPCGGSKSNCYKFISLVTGCSLSTISSVKNHMRRTCGSRDPPEHGLKRWWRENSRRKTSPSNKRKKNEEKFGGDEFLDQEAYLSPRQSPSLPAYEATLCSKDAAMQLQSQKKQLVELQRKVRLQQLQLQQQQQIIEQQILQQNNQQSITTTSSLQQTIQQLLLSPDVGAVTVLAAPKPFSEAVQVARSEDMAKESIMIAEAVENTQGMNSDNLHQMIHISTSSTNPDILQNFQGEKVLTEFTSDCSAFRVESDRLVNGQDLTSAAEMAPSRQLLHLFEIPFSDSSSYTSG